MGRSCIAVIVLAVTAAATGSVSASPLEPHWRAYTQCLHARPVPWRESLAWLGDDRVERCSRFNGARQPALRLPRSVAWARDRELVLALTHVLVIDNGGALVALDPADMKVLWHRDRDPDTVTARFIATGTDLAIVDAHHVTRIDARTGAVAWKAELAHTVWVATDAARLYALTDHGTLAAYELITGARAWTVELGVAMTPAQIALGHDAAVAAIPGSGVRVIELATGRQRAAIALPQVATVARNHAIATAGGRAFVTVAAGPAGSAVDRLLAIDLATGATAWTQPLRAGAVLGAAADRVYTVDAADIVYARDAATGAEAARFGAMSEWVDLLPGTTLEPQVVSCDSDALDALDALGTPLAIQHRELHGRVLCEDCGGVDSTPLPGVTVRIGDATTTSDGTGHYKLSVSGRGSVRIELDHLPGDLGGGRPWDVRTPGFNFFQRADGDLDIPINHR